MNISGGCIVSYQYAGYVQRVGINQDISGWDVSSVTNMQGMFTNAFSIQSRYSEWDVSKVENMLLCSTMRYSIKISPGGTYRKL